ncbi:hypothetical protein I6J22_07725 [Corynebacterium kroppenstedtii]|uniref:Uncharacterized protein n=1 Tax=Corynebacterium kroppenstedtii (strain DSM 44385 / JCM 11950 / CIP 105744 / CCUG 35717) TaxID=645127 RepID=C4LL81_CORK4|nr:hypothetical protein [Corynebacterium kroppenstedtii]ACR18586.1 hypothetical protein ckrop_1870 [Corynebacterium kroppenstedtii DSM 44385]QRP10097.1 hypothetical protein I6J22_07725 [Corynebacterium kroppenstedtii]
MAIFRPYTPAIFGGPHIPSLFSGEVPTPGHLLSLVLLRLGSAYVWSTPEFIQIIPNLP